MQTIDHYSFGTMTIGGEEIRGDLRIHADGRIEKNWWRKEGHLLQTDDIIDLIEMRPATLIVGTGASGMMRPAQSLEEQLKKLGITAIFLPTAQAVERYNSLIAKQKKVAACFHLTC
jgi:hypothetical protein